MAKVDTTEEIGEEIPPPPVPLEKLQEFYGKDLEHFLWNLRHQVILDFGRMISYDVEFGLWNLYNYSMALHEGTKRESKDNTERLRFLQKAMAPLEHGSEAGLERLGKALQGRALHDDVAEAATRCAANQVPLQGNLKEIRAILRRKNPETVRYGRAHRATLALPGCPNTVDLSETALNLYWVIRAVKEGWLENSMTELEWKMFERLVATFIALYHRLGVNVASSHFEWMAREEGINALPLLAARWAWEERPFPRSEEEYLSIIAKEPHLAL